VVLVERLGAEVILGCRAISADGKSSGDLLRQDLIFVRVAGNPHVAPGAKVSLGYDADAATWYSADTEQALPDPRPVSATAEA
ncbi:MAG: hypothetical protein ABTQ30_07710, partial [Rhizobiaceae bacterium]